MGYWSDQTGLCLCAQFALQMMVLPNEAPHGGECQDQFRLSVDNLRAGRTGGCILHAEPAVSGTV